MLELELELVALALATASQRLQDSSMHKWETYPALMGSPWWCDATLFMGGADRAAVVGGGGKEGERLWQWWACRGIVGAAEAQRLHGGIAGVGERGGHAVVMTRQRWGLSGGEG